jgi:hypothetical protein
MFRFRSLRPLQDTVGYLAKASTSRMSVDLYVVTTDPTNFNNTNLEQYFSAMSPELQYFGRLLWWHMVMKYVFLNLYYSPVIIVLNWKSKIIIFSNFLLIQQ